MMVSVAVMAMVTKVTDDDVSTMEVFQSCCKAVRG